MRLRKTANYQNILELLFTGWNRLPCTVGVPGTSFSLLKVLQRSRITVNTTRRSECGLRKWWSVGHQQQWMHQNATDICQNKHHATQCNIHNHHWMTQQEYPNRPQAQSGWKHSGPNVRKTTQEMSMLVFWVLMLFLPVFKYTTCSLETGLQSETNFTSCHVFCTTPFTPR